MKRIRSNPAYVINKADTYGVFRGSLILAEETEPDFPIAAFSRHHPNPWDTMYYLDGFQDEQERDRAWIEGFEVVAYDTDPRRKKIVDTLIREKVVLEVL